MFNIDFCLSKARKNLWFSIRIFSIQNIDLGSKSIIETNIDSNPYPMLMSNACECVDHLGVSGCLGWLVPDPILSI